MPRAAALPESDTVTFSIGSNKGVAPLGHAIVYECWRLFATPIGRVVGTLLQPDFRTSSSSNIGR